jgi:hypothetical protein
MENNTYKNAILGSSVYINGVNSSAFIDGITTANIYNITANITSNCVSIICAVPGPFNLTEVDTINTPLANAGILPGTYGANSNLTIITGNIANPEFSNNSFFKIGTNWNAILNQLPKRQRGEFKLIHIAQPERQKAGTNSYRKLNIYAETVSPVNSHPWSTI